MWQRKPRGDSPLQETCHGSTSAGTELAHAIDAASYERAVVPSTWRMEHSCIEHEDDSLGPDAAREHAARRCVGGMDGDGCRRPRGCRERRMTAFPSCTNVISAARSNGAPPQSLPPYPQRLYKSVTPVTSLPSLSVTLGPGKALFHTLGTPIRGATRGRPLATAALLTT